MTPLEAARVLGIAVTAPWADVRQAYRAQIRTHHPDRAGTGSEGRAATIIEAYQVLSHRRSDDSLGSVGPPRPPRAPDAKAPRPPRDQAWAQATGAPPVARIDADTIVVDAPADETFRWLLEAAHDVGEITYVDRSMPILEVLCQFEGEPATSLLLTVQGRGVGTEVFCTVESIEARPPPPTSAVVDLLELALHRRRPA